MNREDVAIDIYQRLQQEVAEDTRQRATTGDEIARRLASLSRGEKALMLRLLRAP